MENKRPKFEQEQCPSCEYNGGTVVGSNELPEWVVCKVLPKNHAMTLPEDYVCPVFKEKQDAK